MSLTWSKEPPQAPGWYWHRFTGATRRGTMKPIEIVGFEDVRGLRVGLFSNGSRCPFVECEEWAGPMEVPT